MDSRGPDQTARMRSLIWAFAVRLSLKTRFCMCGPCEKEITAQIDKGQFLLLKITDVCPFQPADRKLL